METSGESTRWQRAQALFHEALEQDEALRVSFLEAACDSDPECLAEVLAMLRADGAASHLLDGGFSGVAERFFASPGETIPAQRVGPYQLLRLLGEGGMGVVWLAQREDTAAPVAIKFLPHAGLSPARRERFAREIRTLAKLRHPSIARLYDAGTLPDGTPWFVMEYVEGLRLTQYCEQHELTLDQRLRLFHQVAEAVQYAHGREIIHRDLKPTNILVEKDGTPRLLDFGIARELQGLDDQQEQTRPGLRFLSPDYAAPEWIKDGSVGFYTDVYSLGVILYQMLAGRLPCRPPHGEGTIDRPSTYARRNASLKKAAWGEVDALCMKAMQAEWKQRYASVEALLRDVDHYLNNEPLEAQPARLSYRLSKFLQRRWRPVLAASLTLILVISLVISFTVRLARARDRAVAEAARTERIKQFLLNMMGAGDPGAAPSKDLRVVTLLDRGVKQAEALSADPETQGDLYENLGSMYDMLGEADKGSELLLRAVNRKKAALGPNDPRLIDTLTQLGIAQGDAGKTREAEASSQQALDLASRHFPATDQKVEGAKAALGRIVQQEGDYARAASILEPLVKDRPPSQPDDLELSEALFALSVTEYSLGNHEIAESHAQRCLAVDRKLFSESHPRIAQDLANLCTIKFAQMQYAAAESFCRKSAAILSGWYGPENDDAALVMGVLARTLIAEGKYDQAEPILDDVLVRQERTDGKMDRRVAITLDSLGRIKVKRGDLAGAQRDLTRSQGILHSIYGDTNYQPAVVSADLGDVYTREGRAAEGEQMLRSAVGTLQQTLPPGDPHIALAQAMWGKALAGVKQYRQAETQLSEAYASMARQPVPPLDQMQAVRRQQDAIASKTSYDGASQMAKASVQGHRKNLLDTR